MQSLGVIPQRDVGFIKVFSYMEYMMCICGHHIDIGESYVYNCAYNTYLYVHILYIYLYKHLARYAAISSLNFRWNQ